MLLPGGTGAPKKTAKEREKEKEKEEEEKEKKEEKEKRKKQQRTTEKEKEATKKNEKEKEAAVSGPCPCPLRFFAQATSPAGGDDGEVGADAEIGDGPGGGLDRVPFPSPQRVCNLSAAGGAW